MHETLAASGLGAASDNALKHPMLSMSAVPAFGRLRVQLAIGILVAVVLPPLLYAHGDIDFALNDSTSFNTAVGSFVALLIAMFLFRRAATFPGIGIFSQVLPAVASAYGAVLTAFFALRFEYGRVIFGTGFAAATIFLFLISAYMRSRSGYRFYMVPSAATEQISTLPGAEWVMLTKPELPAQERRPIIIADLRSDLDDAWDRLITQAALAGHPVYHVKQIHESLTGRVEIEHLSENSFGSLVPSSSYFKVKRAIDIVLSLIVLPILVLPMIAVAIAIKMDSRGPVLFRQQRRGYRGRLFTVVKLRTMTHVAETAGTGRTASITQYGDQRITRVGAVLRRTRIDELPQIWNILRGEMSWIGPRPEALALSDWYSAELPFYAYRHVVRPGISGWAQVNQGHVADIERVFEKLHYDFYYIKHFSAWLDLLIFCKTINTVVTGFGAK